MLGPHIMGWASENMLTKKSHTYKKKKKLCFLFFFFTRCIAVAHFLLFASVGRTPRMNSSSQHSWSYFKSEIVMASFAWV
jgi:hypothetical protein